MVIGGGPRGDGCTAPSHREGRSCLQGPSSCLSRALESRARRCEVPSSQPACPRLELEKPALLKSGHLEEVSVQSVRKSLKTVRGFHPSSRRILTPRMTAKLKGVSFSDSSWQDASGYYIPCRRTQTAKKAQRATRAVLVGIVPSFQEVLL